MKTAVASLLCLSTAQPATIERGASSEMNLPGGSAVRAELLGSGFAPLDADRARSVQAPTLLVTGQHSIALFHRLTDRLEELLPHTERIEIRGASHIIHEDNAPAYNAAVLAFLARRCQAASLCSSRPSASASGNYQTEGIEIPFPK